MQLPTLPTTLLLLTTILSVSSSPIPTTSLTTHTLILDTRSTPQFIPEYQINNDLETRSPRFKVKAPGNPVLQPAAPKTGVVQSIKNGLKKLICNGNNCVAEPAVDSDGEGSI